MNKSGLVNEGAGNAEACIAFSAEYATSFAISTSSGMPVNVTVPGKTTGGFQLLMGRRGRSPSSLDPGNHVTTMMKLLRPISKKKFLFHDFK